MKLTPEQIQLAEFPSNGNYAIKGVAGSGKTSIGIHRISYLLENKCPDEDDKILVLTYSRSLIKYLEFLYEKFSASFPKQLKLTDLNTKSPHQRVVINTLNDISYRCFEAMFPVDDQRPAVLWGTKEDQEFKTRNFEKALELSKKEFPKEDILSLKNQRFLEKEIDWMKACIYLKEEDYLGAERVKIGRNDEKIKALPKNSIKRKAIFCLYENIRKLMNENNSCEFLDTEIAAVNYARRNPIDKYTHIIIDESQDLSRLQLEFLKNLVNKKRHSTISFLYDSSQSIYPNSWIGMGKSFASAGFDVTGRTKILRKNYRASNEILSAARQMIFAEEELNDGEPFYCNQTGIRPLHVECAEPVHQTEEIVKLVKNLTTKFGLEDIAITSRYNKNLYSIKDALEQNGIDAEVINRNTENYGSQSIKLITFHSFKGIESQVVIIPDLCAGQVPYVSNKGDNDLSAQIEERRLFYVAMTRASKMLFLFSYGEVSPFVRDIPVELIKHVKPSPVENISLVEEPVAEYEVKQDFQNLVREIDKNNLKYGEQRDNLERVDRKLYPESKLLSRLIEFVNIHHIVEEIDDGNTQEEILDGLESEFKRKKAEIETLNVKVNNLLSSNRELLLEKRSTPNYDEVKSELRDQFPQLGNHSIEILANSEYFIQAIPNKETDFSPQYMAYCKVVETLFRSALPIYGIEMPEKERTLGKLFYNLCKQDEGWNLTLNPLSRIDFITLRNNAAHSKFTKFEDLNKLRRVLFDQKLLEQIITMVN